MSRPHPRSHLVRQTITYILKHSHHYWIHLTCRSFRKIPAIFQHITSLHCFWSFSARLSSTNVWTSPPKPRSFLASHIIILIRKRSDNHSIPKYVGMSSSRPRSLLVSHTIASFWSVLSMTSFNKRGDVCSPSSFSFEISHYRIEPAAFSSYSI